MDAEGSVVFESGDLDPNGDLRDAHSLYVQRGELPRDAQLFISDIVMCETVWVLSSAYRFSRTEIVDALSQLLRARSVVFSSADSIARALDSYRKERGDFADYLIREHGRSAGADTVATFDGALLEEGGFSKP